MMRRRRKFRGLWLPPDLTHAINFTGQAPPATITMGSDTAIKYQAMGPFSNGLGQGETYSTSVPLVGDFNESTLPNAGPGQTLADFSIGYSLRRVVGKIWCSVDQQILGDADNSYLYAITCGIIVRRVGDQGQILALPGPQFYENWTDPYLWRRTWFIANAKFQQSLAYNVDFPSSNAEYGSIQDGPHVDAKTRRTIKAEERLFLDIQATTMNGDNIAPDDPTFAYVWWDLRFFGRTFQSAGNRNNASR